MKARRILCLIATVVLTAAATVPASAATNTNTVVTANYKAPTIQVGVPSTTKVYINPNSLQVKLSSGFQFEEGETPQIVSETSYIWNESEVPVEVSVSVAGTTSIGLKLSPESTRGDDSTDKKVFMFFQMQAVEERELANLDNLDWAETYNEDKHVIVSTTKKTMANIVKLDADKKDSCYGAFTLRGDCIQEPKVPWKTTDRVSASIVFTFTPLPRED